MVSFKRAGLISVISMIVCGPGFAQQGTDAQREACTPDAFRLCMSAMPDSGRVEACLRGNGPRLSAACNAVFNPPQSEQTIAQGRDRRPSRELQQRDGQQRDRGFTDRTDQRRDDFRSERSRGTQDGFGGPPNRFDDD